jgi:hypothetical protein
MTSPLIAYHGDPALKETALEQLAMHKRLDQIVQGLYWTEENGGRGCAVGCLLHDPEGAHERYETEFGIPVQLAWLEDGIFEDLDVQVAKEWPLRFMGAIPVGADLTAVWPRFAIWLMTDPEWGLEHLAEADDVKQVCRMVADAYTRIADGDALTDEEAQQITDAARDAWAARAARDARDAWDAWAARAARAAWDAWAARDARDARDARAARAARDARDARDAFVCASADELVRLLETAPVREAATA